MEHKYTKAKVLENIKDAYAFADQADTYVSQSAWKEDDDVCLDIWDLCKTIEDLAKQLELKLEEEGE